MSTPELVERALARIHAALNAMFATTLIVLILAGLPARGLIDSTWADAGRASHFQLSVTEAQEGADRLVRELERLDRYYTRCPGDPDVVRRTR